MNTTKQHCLSFYNDQGILTLNAKQFDTGRIFVFDIMDHDEPFNLTGCSASLHIQKADGTQFQGEDCCIIDTTKITINPALGNGAQILAADGVNVCELVLKDSEGLTLTTWDFHINVLKRVHNGENLRSSDAYDILDKIDRDEKIRKENESARIEAEQTRKTSESTRQTNETLRINAEEARKTAEAKRQEDTAKAIADAEKATKECIALNHEAESWAHGGTGIRPEEDTDNSKYWCQQSKDYADSWKGSLLPKGILNFAQLPTSGMTAGHLYHINDAFVMDGRFKEGAGYSYPAGTNVYWTQDGKWDCLSGVLTKVLSQAEYNALSESQKKNGTIYYIEDADNSVGEATATEKGLVKVDAALSTTSANPVQNKIVTTGLNDLTATLTAAVGNKVDKVSGKGLSANDYTTAEKNKLSGIAAGAEVNVQADWNVTDSGSDAFIKNKPAIPSVGNGTLTIQRNGTNIQTFTANQSTNKTVNITVPTKTSELTNDSGFVTAGSLTTGVSGVKGNAESNYRTGNVNLTPENIGALSLAGGTMTGNISYKGTKGTYPIIKFIDNPSDSYGNGIVIGGGGATVLGGGESSIEIMNTLTNGGDERLILGNDAEIDFYTNCQNGISEAKHIKMNTDGTITATGFNGNATSATNADTVDGKHANDFLLKKGGTVTGTFKIDKTASSNDKNVTEFAVDGDAKIKINQNKEGNTESLALFEGTPSNGNIKFRGANLNLYQKNITFNASPQIELNSSTINGDDVTAYFDSLKIKMEGATSESYSMIDYPKAGHLTLTSGNTQSTQLSQIELRNSVDTTGAQIRIAASDFKVVIGDTVNGESNTISAGGSGTSWYSKIRGTYNNDFSHTTVGRFSYRTNGTVMQQVCGIYNETGNFFITHNNNTNVDEAYQNIFYIRENGSEYKGYWSQDQITINSNNRALTLSYNDTYFVKLDGSDFWPANNLLNLGYSGGKWKNIYATNGIIQTSDRNEKNTIEDLTSEKAQRLIYGLKPSTYKMNAGTSNRTHWGMISQDIEELLENLGMTSLDFAGFIKSPKYKSTENCNKSNEIIEGEYDYSIRYDEFIAPMIKVIQSQHDEIESLKKRLELLELKL